MPAVAIMSQGLGYHRVSQERLHQATVANGGAAPVISSAGALVEGLHAIGARKVAILTPYMKPLTKLVVDYIEHEGIEVHDSLSLEIPDNLKVGAQDPLAPAEHVKRLDTRGVDAVVLSACVQMPSLASIQPTQDRLGLPVVTAAAATVYRMLQELGLDTRAGRRRTAVGQVLRPGVGGQPLIPRRAPSAAGWPWPPPRHRPWTSPRRDACGAPPRRWRRCRARWSRPWRSRC